MQRNFSKEDDLKTEGFGLDDSLQSESLALRRPHGSSPLKTTDPDGIENETLNKDITSFVRSDF